MALEISSTSTLLTIYLARATTKNSRGMNMFHKRTFFYAFEKIMKPCALFQISPFPNRRSNSLNWAQAAYQPLTSPKLGSLAKIGDQRRL
jgi:hypothetical protein